MVLNIITMVLLYPIEILCINKNKYDFILNKYDHPLIVNFNKKCETPRCPSIKSNLQKIAHYHLSKIPIQISIQKLSIL